MLGKLVTRCVIFIGIMKTHYYLNSSNFEMREDCRGHKIVSCGCLTVRMSSIAQ